MRSIPYYGDGFLILSRFSAIFPSKSKPDSEFALSKNKKTGLWPVSSPCQGRRVRPDFFGSSLLLLNLKYSRIAVNA